MNWRPFVKCVDCGAVAEIHSFVAEAPTTIGVLNGQIVKGQLVTLSVPEKCPACHNKPKESN